MGIFTQVTLLSKQDLNIANSSNMHLFIIPGNPPAVHFYKIWAEEIQRAYSGSSVCVSPYLQLPSNSDSLAYLKDTAASHGKELLAFHNAVKSKVIVIGHSLGAWMALRLLEEYDAIIENCLFLYPFLRRPNFKARTILRFMRYLYKIPFSKNLLIGGRGILEKFSSDLQLVSDEELRTSLTLAYHEYKVIGQKKEALQIPEHLREKLHMIYCDEDRWCPKESIHEIKKWISSEKLDATHGFITSEQERKIVLQALKKLKNTNC